MRDPSFMDRLDPDTRKVVRRMQGGVVVGYLVMMLAVLFAVKVTSSNHRVAMETAAPATSVPGDAFSAVAAERPRTLPCAERDLNLITQLHDHGEAMDVPVEVLNSAFLALVRARGACAEGRIDEALAIYDSIVIAPGQTVR